MLFKINELNQLFYHEFVVVEEINILLIIGADWLQKVKAVVDLKINMLTVEDEGNQYTTELLPQVEHPVKTFNIRCSQEDIKKDHDKQRRRERLKEKAEQFEDLNGICNVPTTMRRDGP